MLFAERVLKLVQVNHHDQLQRLCNTLDEQVLHSSIGLLAQYFVAVQVGASQKARDLYGQLQKIYHSFDRSMSLAEWCLWGHVLRMAQNPTAACKVFIDYVKQVPEDLYGHYFLALTSQKLFEYETALKHFELCSRREPDSMLFLESYADMLSLIGRDEDAFQLYEKVYVRKSKDQIFLRKIIQFLKKACFYDRAEIYAKHLIQAFPNDINVFLELVRVLIESGKLDLAEEILARLFKHQQLQDQLYEALADLYIQRNDLPHAIECFEKSIALSRAPSMMLLCRYAECLFKRGQFEKGWRFFEKRQQIVELSSFARTVNLPEWEPQQSLLGRLLIHPEQGLGDEIMFANTYMDLEKEGVNGTIICRSRLKPLFERSFPNLHFIGYKSREPRWGYYEEPIDYTSYSAQLISGSLCTKLRKTAESFPQYESYLKADKARAAVLRERYRQNSNDMVIGFAWEGGFLKENIRRQRSTGLEQWLKLFKLPNIRWLNLQHGPVEKTFNDFRQQHHLDLIWDKEIDLFNDADGLAAQIEACDLIITVDNSTAHLAGALGKEVWILLPHISEWRWQTDPKKSVWYPSAHLFRCDARDAWKPLLLSVKDCL